ncbi:MAG: PAS domain S-box protein [Desulfuromonadales bacterium]|nr:PAS domain S-box protein [Desulfuromonadales bacterium]
MAKLTTLKRAYTVSYLLVAAIPVMLFGLVVIQQVAEHQLKGVQDRNISQAKSIAEEVDAFLLEVQSDLQHVKHVLDSSTMLQPLSIDDYLAEFVRNSQFFESIYFLDSNLNVLQLGVLPQQEARREDFISLDFSGHQLFKEQGQIQGPVWSNTFVSLVTGEPSVTLGLDLKQGFLLGNVRLRSLGKLLNRYATYGDVQAAIIDDNGTLVAHNVSDLAMQRINFSNHPVVIKAMGGVDSTREFKEGSHFYLESAANIQLSNWVIWVGLDMNAVNAPINNLRNILIGFLAVTVILAGFTSLFNVRRLMRPLTALGQRAGQIADGRYDFEYQPSGFSEIDVLASQISNMTNAIKVREASIINNERRFRDLVNSIDGIVWEMGYPSFNFLFVSQQAEAILGYPLQDWYEDPVFWEKVTHEEDLAQAKAYCQLMAEKKEDHDFEYRMIAADGRIVWIRDLVTVVVENDRPVRLLGVMIDVTEQKELLEELRHSEENYREIFNSTSDAIFIHDADTGKVLDVNQAMLNIFCCSYKEALVGGIERYSMGVHPYTMQEAKEKLQIARDKGMCSFEWLARRGNGETFWAEVYLRSAVIGNQARILAAVRDISSRKETELELAQYRSNLEDLVRERSAQLEQAQVELVQKERLAVLGQLTATVSHEIRNPLGTVANALYVLKEALPDKGFDHLKRPMLLAERNVERCDNIISDLLDFSRQRKINKQPVDIDAWLSELLSEFNFPEHVELKKDLQACCQVPVDAERLRRVIVNVVTNALQALDEVEQPDKQLTICTRVANGRCEIDVQDNGPGMSEDVLAQIFEPMFSTKNFGVGLGVPIIRNILIGHGGGVQYLSEKGVGTTVEMWLPINKETRT